MVYEDVFEVLKTAAPDFSAGEVARVLADAYGVVGTLRALVSERDQNFIVTAADGGKFLLKISNAEEDPRITDFHTNALLHVAEADPGLPIPRVARTRDGAPQAAITGANGGRHAVRLLSWLDGVPLSTVDERPDIAASMGAMLARLALALGSYEHDDSDFPLLWDLKQAGRLVALLPQVPERSMRALCDKRLTAFVLRVAPQLPKLRQQVIYNDLNPSNLLVAADDRRTIAGIIDFGDMVRSALVADVAVGAAYLCDGGERPLAMVERFVAGYHSVSPLQDDEIELLFDLIMTRHVMTVVITHWRAAQYPENRRYILRNEPRARQTIASLDGLKASAVTAALRAACNK